MHVLIFSEVPCCVWLRSQENQNKYKLCQQGKSLHVRIYVEQVHVQVMSTRQIITRTYICKTSTSTSYVNKTNHYTYVCVKQIQIQANLCI